MLHYIILIQRSSGVLLFESKLSDFLPDIKSELLSGMIIALVEFSKELQIGELSTFKTLDQKFLISVTEHVLVALIIDIADSEREFEMLAVEIGKKFEEMFDIKTWDGVIEYFDPFKDGLRVILNDFQWKQVGDIKKLNEPFLEGFILYDSRNKEFHNYAPKDLDAIKIIQDAESRAENQIRIEDKKQIIYIIKNESVGCIVLFESRVPSEKINRYVKTFSFLIQNLNNTYVFQNSLKKSAEKLFSKEVIDSIIQNNNKTLFEVFISSENLNLIENIRKFKVRVLIEFNE